MATRIQPMSDAVQAVRARDTLAVPLGPGQPAGFLHALGEREDFDDLEVFAALLVDLFPLFTRPGVRLRSGFFGPAERVLRMAGHAVEYIPASFREFEHMAARMKPRVMATAASPPDAEGGLSLSLHAGATVDELRHCGRDSDRVLIVEVNEGLPRTLGLPPEHTHRLEVSEVDILVESDRPILILEDPPPTEAERGIAAIASKFIPDGATLQTGIGAVPNQIAQILAQGTGGDYGIHTEMFTDGLMKLHLSGKVTNRKGLYDGFSVATFAAGSRALYDWLDENEEVRFLPVAAINTPAEIARNRNMVSINAAMAVDLAGQVAADAIGLSQYSGVGGHEEFTEGASIAPDGRSLMCMPATVEIEGEVRSRIRAGFFDGTLVTTPRHQTDIVVTEFGAAELQGRTVEERARALIAIADPRFRSDLQKEWDSQRGPG